MNKSNYHFILAMVLSHLLLSACATTPTLQEQLLGSWVGDIQGFEVTLVYAETQVEVEGFGMTLDYSLDGDQITMNVPGQGTMSATVEINGDQMIQTDNNSGEQNVFRRKN